MRRPRRRTSAAVPDEKFVYLRERVEDAEDLAALRRAMLEDEGGPGPSLDQLKQELGMRPGRKAKRTRKPRARS